MVSEPTGSRGILTKKDREFLTEPEEREKLSSSARSQRWSDIRDRIRNAMDDFRILARYLDPEVVDDIFGVERVPVDNEEEGTFVEPEWPDSLSGIPFGIEFFIRAVMTNKENAIRPFWGLESAMEPFIDDVEQGMQSYLNRHHNMTADIEISVESSNVQEIEEYRKQLENRDSPMTHPEQIEAASRLGRAGYSLEEIKDILNEEQK